MNCEECGNAKFSLEDKEYKCQLNNESHNECFIKNGEHFVQHNSGEIEVTLDAEFIATSVAAIIYNQGKAKIFNILESQIEHSDRLRSTKRITQDVIAEIAKQTSDFLKEVLEGWEEKATAGGLLEGEEEETARKEYEDLQEVIK